MIRIKKILERLTKSGIDIRKVENSDEMEKFSFFIEKVHYLQSLPKNINFKFGAFYNGEMIGAIAYGAPSTPQISKTISGNFDKSEIQELRRLVIARKDDIVRLNSKGIEIPEWYNKSIEIASSIPNLSGQIISAGNLEMKLRIPTLKIIITFADSTKGHHGGVYQATINPGITGDYFGQASDKKLHLYIYYLGNTKERKETIQRLSKPEGNRKPLGVFPKPNTGSIK